MQKQMHQHTRDFLVPTTLLDEANTRLKAYRFLEMITDFLPPTMVENLQLRGAELADADVVILYLEEEGEQYHKIALIHFLGLYADDQSFYRFSVADFTQESSIIAAVRHASNLNAGLHEMPFARTVPA